MKGRKLGGPSERGGAAPFLCHTFQAEGDLGVGPREIAGLGLERIIMRDPRASRSR